LIDGIAICQREGFQFARYKYTGFVDASDGSCVLVVKLLWSSTLGEEEEVGSVVAQGREEVVMDGGQAL